MFKRWLEGGKGPTGGAIRGPSWLGKREEITFERDTEPHGQSHVRGEGEAWQVGIDRRLGRRAVVGEHVLIVEVGPTMSILISCCSLAEIEVTCSRLVLTMICGFLAENSLGFQGTPGPKSDKKCYWYYWWWDWIRLEYAHFWRPAGRPCLGGGSCPGVSSGPWVCPSAASPSPASGSRIQPWTRSEKFEGVMRTLVLWTFDRKLTWSLLLTWL